MKVAQITYSAYDSSAVTRLNNGLKKIGVDSKIFAFHFGNNVKGTLIRRTPYERVLDHVKWIAERTYINRKYTNRTSMLFDISNYGSLSKKKLLDFGLDEYDIINLHYINGMFSYKQFYSFLHMGIPVVWTMHDSWAFTGGCHHGCDNYKDKCGKCWALGSTKENDISNKCLLDKERYTSDQLRIVSPSHWMDDKVKYSNLFRYNKSTCIHNGIDTNIFCYKNKDQAESRDIVILMGANSPMDSPFKGYKYSVDTMNIFAKKFPNYSKRIIIRFFGKNCDVDLLKKDFDSSYRLESMGYISSQEDMARLYQSSDFFLCTSTFDNLPSTLIESISCGTPCISFCTGGIQDIIEHKKNGYLSKTKDANDLAEGIKWCIDNNRNNVLGHNGRQTAIEKFKDTEIAKLYAEFYSEALKK